MAITLGGDAGYSQGSDGHSQTSDECCQDILDIPNDQDNDLKPGAILINLPYILIHQQFSWTRILNYFYFKYKHGKVNEQLRTSIVTDQTKMCYFLLLDVI